MRLDTALPAKYSEKNRAVTPPDFKPACSSVSQSQLEADKYAATKKVTTRHAKEASMQKERIEKRFINGQFSSRITATFTGVAGDIVASKNRGVGVSVCNVLLSDGIPFAFGTVYVVRSVVQYQA